MGFDFNTLTYWTQFWIIIGTVVVLCGLFIMIYEVANAYFKECKTPELKLEITSLTREKSSLNQTIVNLESKISLLEYNLSMKDKELNLVNKIQG